MALLEKNSQLFIRSRSFRHFNHQKRKIKNSLILIKTIPFIISSISDFSSSVVNAFCQSDIILHCAGSVRGRLPDDFKTANIDAIQNLPTLQRYLRQSPGFILISLWQLDSLSQTIRFLNGRESKLYIALL